MKYPLSENMLNSAYVPLKGISKTMYSYFFLVLPMLIFHACNLNSSSEKDFRSSFIEYNRLLTKSNILKEGAYLIIPTYGCSCTGEVVSKIAELNRRANFNAERIHIMITKSNLGKFRKYKKKLSSFDIIKDDSDYFTKMNIGGIYAKAVFVDNNKNIEVVEFNPSNMKDSMKRFIAVMFNT